MPLLRLISFPLGLCLGWLGHMYWVEGDILFQPVYVDGHVVESSDVSVATNHENNSPLPRPSEYATFRALLKATQFEQAMILYEQVVQNQPNALPRYKQAIDAYIADLEISNDYETVVRLLNRYIAVAYQDAAALLQLAHAAQQLKRFTAEVEHLYSAKALVIDADKLKDIDHRLKNAIQAQANVYQSFGDHDALIAFYDYLITQDPYQASYYLKLAQSLIVAGKYQRARESLALVNDVEFDSQVRKLTNKLERAIQPTTNVALRSLGEHYIVDAQINEELSIALMIDTGASLCVIKRSQFEQLSTLNYSEVRHQRINTANGQFVAQIIRLQSLQIADLPVYDLEVAVIEDSNMQHFDGLLGMNYLKHFEFFIDQAQTQLQLSPSASYYD